MKFKDYITDHLVILLVNLVAFLLVQYLFLMFSISPELNIFITSIHLIVFTTCFLYPYFKKVHFHQIICKQLDMIDQKTLVFEDKNKKHDVVAINWGYAKIDEGKVVILADGAVYVSGNSESELANSLEAARNLIESMSSDTNAFAATISKMENVVRAR